MIENFPIPVVDSTLDILDFCRFAGEYSRILQQKIPTAAEVVIYTDVQKLHEHLPDDNARNTAAKMFSQPEEAKKVVKITRDGLLFPFVTAGGHVVVAHVPSLDPLVVKRAARDWLADVQQASLRDFLAVKQNRTDAETGLCNLVHLVSLLDASSALDVPVQLVLVDLPPRNRSPRDAFHHARRAACALQSFVERGLVHHLGQCVFAIFQKDSPEEKPAECFGSMLVGLLKREGFYRVHIGSSRESAGTGAETTGRTERGHLLAEAWAALRKAEQRGPFTFCDYSILARPEKHPLHPVEDAILRKIRKMYQRSDAFCLVELKRDGCSGGELVELAGKYTDTAPLLAANESVLLFLDGYNVGRAQTLTADLLRSMNRGVDPALHVSAGIGHYPYADFQKAEIPANSRKALLHAGFFGAGAVVAFDAVSLNISGDIHYGDGDLPKALKEYRRGLVCEAANVNLLNSLGVTYAMLDRHSLARESFKKVLAVEPNNFMALYNLGLGEVRRGDYPASLKCFEQALAAYREEDGAEVGRDLQLQLAKLYCRLTMFDKAHALLTEWFDACAGTQQSGAALRYLGEACHGLGRRAEAKVWLQKALRFNELDPEAMSLLGLVYMEDGEGAEIALALCEKGVELNMASTAARLRLAKVQLQCDLLVEARQNLTKCLGDRRLEGEVRACMGEVWHKLGRKKQAERWLAKVA